MPGVLITFYHSVGRGPPVQPATQVTGFRDCTTADADAAAAVEKTNRAQITPIE
jgi:hypothetical protein